MVFFVFYFFGDVFVGDFFVGCFVDLFVVDWFYVVLVELVEIDVFVYCCWQQGNWNMYQFEVDGVFLDYVWYCIFCFILRFWFC